MNSSYCKEPNCKAIASYGFRFAHPEYCPAHGKKKGAVTQFQVCVCGDSTPRFKFPDDERTSCCGKCKKEGMVNAVDRRCECKKHLPNYGFLTDERPNYCAECKKEGMINIKTKKKHCPCGVVSSFGFPGEKATCCMKCKKEGMISLMNILCECGKTAAFGLLTDKRPSFCNSCKKDGMVNIITKKCECGKAVPVFGNPYDKTPRFCKDCKKEGMVNIVCKKCECGKAQPIFGNPSDTTPTCCVKCKKEGMVDIRSTKCECGRAQPVYGMKGGKATCCADCKKEEMVNVKAKMCECGKAQATFGIPGTKIANWCNTCKKDGMFDVLTINCPTRKCKGLIEYQSQGHKCPFEHHGKKKYDYYCTKCFELNFPEDPRTGSIRDKTDENKVRDYLIHNFKDISFIHNKPLWTGQKDCSCRRRIDFRSLIGNTLLCVEVDEDQHRYRDQNDEDLRYDDLMMLHGGKFIFVRFNPNLYKDSEGKRKNPSIDSRLEKLGQTITYQLFRILQEKNEELLEIIPLFFDGYT